METGGCYEALTSEEAAPTSTYPLSQHLNSRRLNPHSMTQLDTSSHHPISDDPRVINELIAVKVKLAEVMENIDLGELHTNR